METSEARLWRTLLPLAAIVIPIVAVALAATSVSDAPQMRAVVDFVRTESRQWWAVPLFALLYLTFALFCLPVGLLSAVAAVAWGWRVGGCIELVTLTLVAIVPYLIGRRGLGSWARGRVDVGRAPDSTFTFLLLRIVPIVPYVAMNYLAGVTRLRFRDFVWTTFLGSIPSVFLFAFFVDTMAGAALGRAEQSKIIVACLGVATLAIAVRILAKRWKARAR